MTSAIVQQSGRIGMPMETQLAAVQEEDNTHRDSQRSYQINTVQQSKKPLQGVRGQVVFINIT